MFRYTWLKIILFGTIILLHACNDSENDVMTANELAIEKFVKSFKNPDTLIVINRISYIRIERGDMNQSIGPGDSVYFYFVARTLRDSVPYETNMRAAANYYRMDTTLRSFDPMGVKLGSSELIAGLDLGLQQAHVGDHAIIVFNSDLGYGSKPMGIVSPNSPLFFEIWPIRAKKN